MAAIEVSRGDVVVVDLAGWKGGEQRNDPDTHSRPCVVVQNNAGNRASPLTIVAAIADSRQYKGYPQQVLVEAHELGPLAKESVILLGHLRTIDRDTRILRNLGPLPAAVMARVDEALKSSLGL